MPLLKGYEWQMDVDAFRKLGPNGFEPLLAIANDPDVINLYRGRALAALTLYPNDAVWDFMNGYVSAGQDPVMRRRTAEAMCRTFRAQRENDVEATMIPLLQATDPQLRTKAAKCLQGIKGKTAQDALAHYRRSIKQPWEARAAGFGETSTP